MPLYTTVCNYYLFKIYVVGIFFQWISIIGSKQLDLIEVHIIKSFKNRILWKISDLPLGKVYSESQLCK